LAGCDNGGDRANNDTNETPPQSYKGIDDAVSTVKESQSVVNALGGTGTSKVKVYLLGNTDNDSTTFRLKMDDGNTYWFYLYKMYWENELDNQSYSKYFICITFKKMPGYDKQNVGGLLVKPSDTATVENYLNYKTIQKIDGWRSA